MLHLAALMSLTMDRDPWMGLDVNIRGTQNVIEACCVNGVKKLVFASSNAVYGYGPGIVGDLVETTPFHSAGAPPAAILYGASKIVGEQLCRDAHAKRGLDYVVVRYSTVYGERQHYRAANALYIIETHDRVRQGLRPRVIGDGSETKHFVHVSDAARANAAAFAADATNVAVNISGPKPVTTLEIVRLVTELAGKDAGARACRARSGQGAADLRRRLADRPRAGGAHHRLASAGRHARGHRAADRVARSVWWIVGRNKASAALRRFYLSRKNGAIRCRYCALRPRRIASASSCTRRSPAARMRPPSRAGSPSQVVTMPPAASMMGTRGAMS